MRVGEGEKGVGVARSESCPDSHSFLTNLTLIS